MGVRFLPLAPWIRAGGAGLPASKKERLALAGWLGGGGQFRSLKLWADRGTRASAEVRVLVRNNTDEWRLNDCSAGNLAYNTRN